jgi:proprotein convertase subtilisin/kexin type 5
LAGCLQGFIDNGFGGCVSRVGVSGCSYPYFYQQASCVSVCSPGTFPDSSTRVCGACSSNCFSCMSSAFCTACSSGFDLSNGICVAGQQCSNNQFKYNGVCLSACPVGTISSNGYCQRRCDAGLYFLNGKCYDICPSTVAFTTDAACVSSCPTGFILNGTVCKLSAQNCPIGQFYNTSSNTCAACSSSCLQCQYTSAYCIACPSGQTLSGSVCVNALNPCGSGKYQSGTGQCATCSVKCT